MKVVINTTWLGVVIVVALVAATGYLLAQLYLPKTGYTVAGRTSPQTNSLNSLNIFQGRITNAKVSVGRLEGVTTYDANCIDSGNRMTECDAGIRTAEFGELNFHYRHNMAVQPCLHMFGAERVIIEILDSDGNARITRTIDLSGMGGHHG